METYPSKTLAPSARSMSQAPVHGGVGPDRPEIAGPSTRGSAAAKTSPFPECSGLSVFSLWYGALATALHATISFGLKRIRTSKFGALNNVISGRVNAEIVVNGSSRALTHYDPRIIADITGKSAYTLGMNGIQIDVELAMLKTYLKHNSKPRLIIQNLESFSFETTKRGEIYDAATYVPYLGEDELYKPLLAIDPAVWKWKYIPLYGYAVEDMRFTWVWGLLGCLGISWTRRLFSRVQPATYGMDGRL